MTELSSSYFSSGLSKATDVRTLLLEALGAEPEWTVGSEDSVDVVWLAGPAPTFFSVQAGGTSTPGLAVMTVRGWASPGAALAAAAGTAVAVDGTKSSACALPPATASSLIERKNRKLALRYSRSGST